MGLNIKTEVDKYASVAFTLLGVLFGMGIMVFIFANLTPDTAGLVPNSLAYNISNNITVQNLQAVQTYTSQSDTQMVTIVIAIVLAILLSVFFLFWKAFKGNSGGSRRSMSSASSFQ